MFKNVQAYIKTFGFIIPITILIILNLNYLIYLPLIYYTFILIFIYYLFNNNYFNLLLELNVYFIYLLFILFYLILFNNYFTLKLFYSYSEIKRNLNYFNNINWINTSVFSLNNNKINNF